MYSVDFKKWRNRVKGIDTHIHFNHAGCSFPDQQVFTAIQSHLEKEQLIDGYALQFSPDSELDKVYGLIAELIHASPSEIAVTQSASDAIVKALFAIPFQAGDRMLTSPWEYGTNYLNYMYLRDIKGIHIDIVPLDARGNIDVEGSRKLIQSKTKLISITHVPTSSGSIAPIDYFGELASEFGILYMVDACQSIGQIPVDVRKIKCDILCATSRKYMRGPRGMGFLYIKESCLARLKTPYINMMSAKWIAPDQYSLEHDIKLFDHWEKSFSILKGFEESVRLILEIGVENIWKRIQDLAEYFRASIERLEHYQCMDKGEHLCGIVTFKHDSISTEQVFETLAKAGINTSISYNWSSFTDLNEKQTESVNRASIHFVNTFEEIDKCVQILSAMDSSDL